MLLRDEFGDIAFSSEVGRRIMHHMVVCSNLMAVEMLRSHEKDAPAVFPCLVALLAAEMPRAGSTGGSEAGMSQRCFGLLKIFL